MHNFCKILKIRLDESLDISRFRYSHEPGIKPGIVLYKVIRILLGIALFALITILYHKLAEAGLAKVLPTMSYFLASLVSVFITITNINEILTGNEDSEFLLSTPISAFVHVAVMFLTLYVRCLVAVVVLCVPAAMMYMKYVSEGAFLGYWILGVLLTSLPLGGIACLAGTVIVLSLSHHPKKEQIQSVITMILVIVGSGIVLFLANRIDAILATAATNSEAVSEEILRLFIQNFRFSRMYQYAVVDHSIGYMIVFPILSIIWYGAFAFAFGMGYRVMIISFRCPVNYKAYQWEKQRKQPLKRALFRREMNQLLRSKSYMIHSLSGIAVGYMTVFSTLVWGCGLLEKICAGPKEICFLCMILGLGNTTYCSYSIEGRRHWITETSPIDERIVYQSKVRANLVFTLPFAIIGGFVLGYTMQVALLWKILFLCIPAVYAIVNAYWGIAMDQKFGSYSKESEQQAMHQGLSYVLGYLPGIVLPLCFLPIL